MKKIIALITLLSMILIFAGCSRRSDANNSNTVIDNRTNTTVVSDNRADNQSTETQAEKENVSDEEFEKKAYLFENSIGDTLCFLAVKNNSNSVVSIIGNGIAKDVNGNMIGADDMAIDVLGPGEESIGYFYFDDVSGVTSVDYTLSYNVSPRYYPVISNLAVEQTLNNENVTVSVTNNGNIVAQFVQAYALFFDANNNIIGYDDTYVVDSDSEIKPGRTISVQLDSRDPYDHVEVYLTGRSDGSVADVVQGVNKEDFIVDGHLYTNSIGSSLYFLVIANNSNDTVEVNGNGVAKDANDNVVGAASTQINVLGPGETSICYFYFDGVDNIDHIEYDMDYSTDVSYQPVISNLSIQETVNDKNVIVAATNVGDYPAEFVEAYALFFDANNNIISYDSKYLTDDDSEIKPGNTLIEQLDARDTFDHVNVYFTGRANK